MTQFAPICNGLLRSRFLSAVLELSTVETTVENIPFPLVNEARYTFPPPFGCLSFWLFEDKQFYTGIELLPQCQPSDTGNSV